MDTLTGKSKKGGDVQLTCRTRCSRPPIKGLGKQNGSVVALDPTTGRDPGDVLQPEPSTPTG